MGLDISFYVSGKATRLRKIIKSRRSNNLVESTKLVICDNVNNSDLNELLSDHGITFIEIDYSELKNDKSNSLSDIILSKFYNYSIDYCFCYGNQILKGELLNRYKNKIINFHPSVLPFLKGRNAIDKAIEKGVMILGNTAHFLTDKVDGGPIIMQSLIHANTFSDGGYDKVLDLQVDMNIQIFNWLSEGRLTFGRNGEVKVKESDYSTISFYPKLEL